MARTGATFVPPYDAPRIVAGTAALERLAPQPDLEQIWVPVGGGGLAAGKVIATGRRPVCWPSRPWRETPKIPWNAAAGKQPCHRRPSPTACARHLGRLNFDILKRAATPVALASEEAIAHWTKCVAAVMKIVVEPSAAVTLAAIAEQPGIAQGRSA